MHADDKGGHRKNRTYQSFKRALHQERPANETIGSTHKTHNGNLATTCVDGKANGVVDKDKGHKDEKCDKNDCAYADVGSYAKKTLNRLTTVLDIAGRIVLIIRNGLKIIGSGNLLSGFFNLLWILHLNNKRGGNRILPIKRSHRIGSITV